MQLTPSSPRTAQNLQCQSAQSKTSPRPRYQYRWFRMRHLPCVRQYIKPFSVLRLLPSPHPQWLSSIAASCISGSSPSFLGQQLSLSLARGKQLEGGPMENKCGVNACPAVALSLRMPCGGDNPSCGHLFCVFVLMGTVRHSKKWSHPLIRTRRASLDFTFVMASCCTFCCVALWCWCG